MNRRHFLRNGLWVAGASIFVPRLLRAQYMPMADPHFLARANASTPSTPFVPTAIDGLVLWLKADTAVYIDAGTTPALDGQSVYRWVDQSASAIVASQSDAAKRPTFISSGINGLPSVRFDGTEVLIHTLGNHVTVSMFLVVTADSSAETGYRGFFSIGSSSAGLMVLRRTTNAQWATFDTAPRSANTTLSTGTTYLLEVLRASNGTGQFFLNGVSDGTFPGAIGQATKHIGGETTGPQYTAFTLSELLVYNSTLSEGNRQAVEGYLSAKYAI